MSELTGDIGKGIIAFIFGSMVSFFSLKGKLKGHEEEMLRMRKEMDSLVCKQTCEAVHSGLDELIKRDREESQKVQSAIWDVLRRMDDKLDRIIEKG